MNYDNFDLNLIKTFISVYESGGIVVASKKLFISQPAVSVSIKKLENIVGGKLFVRLPKGVKPTLEGEKFYQFCKSAIKQLNLGIEEFRSFSNLSNGSLSIGASHDVINYVLMPKIKKFLTKYPNICINFVEIIPKRISEYISNGSIDIAFLEDKTLVGEYNCVSIEELENVFFASNSYSKNIMDLIDKNFSFYKKDSGNYQSLEKLIRAYRLNLNSKFFVSNFKTMENICEITDCIGFAPKKYIDTSRFKIIPVNFSIENTKIYMCFPKNENTSFVCREFIDLIKND